MGVMESVGRDIPFYEGKGDHEKAREIKDLAFSFIVTTSALIALGIAAFAVFARHSFRHEIVVGLLLVAAIIILQRLNNLLICILRAFKKFSIESSQMVLSAIVNAIFIALLTYRFQIYGFILAMVLSFLFNILYLVSRYHYDFHWTLELKKIKPLIAFGMPLMSLGLLMTVIRSLDRIMLAKYLGFEAVGLYSIALMTCSYMSNFSIAFATVLFPHGQEKYAAAGNAQGMNAYLKKSSTAYALTMPILIGAAALLAPMAVVIFLPKFISSLLALRILVLSAFFVALLQPYYDLLITIRRHFALFPFLGGSILISIALYWGAIRLGFGIGGMAVAGCVISFLMFTALFFIASRYLCDRKVSLEFYAKLLGCFLYLGLFVFVLVSFFSTDALTIKNILSQILLFVLFCSPLLWILNRKFFIVKILTEKFKK
jgi:O-antigen/teichoic acid export membrane protein